MGYRLSKIYTRTGDDGSTGLSNGKRVAKSDARIVAIGDIDELNCVIGIVLAGNVNIRVHDILLKIQHHLFNLGGELSLPGHALLENTHVTWLEEQLDLLNQELEPLQDFILPGGCSEAAYCHFARTVCRRAERSLIMLKQQEMVSEILMKYLNRLSDLLFVAARYVNKQANRPDILWNSSL